MNLASFDLNLLKVFAAVYAERNVSRAAEAVGLSQPAVSNALKRLRLTCADELFVVTSRGMEPTSFAQSMAGPVHEALNMLHQALVPMGSFDPSRHSRKFRLLMSDAGQLAVLPVLMNHLENIAPAVTIQTLQIPQDQYGDALRTGAADIAIGHLTFLRGDFYRSHLFHDGYVCIASVQHDDLGGGITLDRYSQARHVQVTVGNADAMVEGTLNKLRRRRQIALSVTQYHAAIDVVRQSRLLATVPKRAVQSREGLWILDLPFETPRAEVRQFWHRRAQQDPGHKWLRGQLSDLLVRNVYAG